jgi:hypothetical protein
LENTGNVTLAARECGVCRNNVYRVRKIDPVFASRWANIMGPLIEEVENEAHKRAIEGVEEPVFYQGKQVGVKIKKSDSLLTFLLKAYKPEIYNSPPKEEKKGKFRNLAKGKKVALASEATRGAEPGKRDKRSSKPKTKSKAH